jgi:hypothetical protein
MIRWRAATGRVYEVHCCDDLAAGSWTVLPPSYVISDSEAEFVDTTAPAAGPRFYRLLVRGPQQKLRQAMRERQVRHES